MWQRATVWGYSRGGWLACNLAGRHPERVDRIVVGGFAMHAHRDEVDRTLVPMAGCLRDGDWAGVWQKFGIVRQRLPADDARRATIRWRWRRPSTARCVPRGFVDPASITCPAFYYVGIDDWIVPHVQADVARSRRRRLDVIAGQAHLGAHFEAVESVLSR